MTWQLDGHNFIYELNNMGINKWWAQVSSGYGDDGCSRPSSEEIEKIARLMLTAPDLLGVVEEFVRLCEHGNPLTLMKDLGALVNPAIKVIKKAKGGE